VSEIKIEWIKEEVRRGKYEFSGHGDEERQADKISINEIETALLRGEILENYPKDPRGPSCLVLGYGNEGYPMHVVCGKTPSERLRIITVYIPSLPKWLDPRTRRR
jgi:hypothetical protein